MSDKASDHNTHEHIHTYEHLVTTCKKEGIGAYSSWERKDEFFCTECLDIKTKTTHAEGSWPPSWWIEKEDVR